MTTFDLSKNTMGNTCTSEEHTMESPNEWMNAHMPEAKRVDFSEYSMSKWEFPQHVKEYIQQNWTKINDINGGEYQKPETTTNSKTVYGGVHMDEYNKKALDVFLTKGSDEAVKYMMTHPETGHSISYAESRMYYG